MEKERILWKDESGRIWIPDNAITLKKETVCDSVRGAGRSSWNRDDLGFSVKIRDMEHDEGGCETFR